MMILSKLERHLEPTLSSRFLEIGPGKGALADLIASRYQCVYIGIEAADCGIDHLVDKGFSAIQAIVPPFPVKDESVDFVVAQSVLEHMPNRHSTVEFMTEARRVLVPGGVAVISVPDALDWGPYFYHDYTHVTPFTGHGLRSLAADTGWAVLDCFWSRSCFTGFSGHIVGFVRRCCPWSLLARITTGYSDEGIFSKALTGLMSTVNLIARKPIAD